MKKIIILVISVMLTGVFGFFSYRYYQARHIRKSAEKTVSSFIDAANEQNVDKFLSYIEPTEAQLIELGVAKLDSVTESTAFSKFKRWLPYISDVTDLELIPQFDESVTSTEINKDNASVTVTLTNRKTNKDTACVFHLIDINGTWYIQYATPIK